MAIRSPRPTCLLSGGDAKTVPKLIHKSVNSGEVQCNLIYSISLIYKKILHTYKECLTLNPLGPHDALKHHFASLKNDLVSRNRGGSERKFSWNCFKNNSILFHLSPTSSHFHPLQVENCDSNSRLVVDGDDNGKFRLERVKARGSTLVIRI